VMKIKLFTSSHLQIIRSE